MKKINEAVALTMPTLRYFSATDWRDASGPGRAGYGFDLRPGGWRVFGADRDSFATEVEAWHWLERQTPEWQFLLKTNITVHSAVMLQRGLIALECIDQAEFNERRKSLMNKQKALLKNAIEVALDSQGLRLASSLIALKESAFEWYVPTCVSAEIEGFGRVALRGYPSIFASEDGIEEWDFRWIAHLPWETMEKMIPLTQAMTKAIYEESSLKVRYSNVRELWCET
jgi:hypothetical protein